MDEKNLVVTFCKEKLNYASKNGYTYQNFFNDFGKIEKTTLIDLQDWLKTIDINEAKQFIEYISKITNGTDAVYFDSMQRDVLMFIAERKEDDASEMIVNYIKEYNYIKTTIDDIKAEVWFYQEGIYKPNGESKIKEITRRILGKIYTTQRVNKIIEKIKADTQIDCDEFFNANYLDEIPVLNGILNIKSKTLSKFRPDKIFFNKIPVKYDPSKKCPNIDKFLGDVLKDKDNTGVIEEVFGYCLYKNHFIEKAIMFIGDGRNGKSKTISLLKVFLGAENCCSVSLSQLVPESFSVSGLHGKLANIAGDLNNTSLKETGLFKEITGRDRVGAKRKFLKDLYFENYSKQIFACNELPKVYDTSDGFWERWVLFEFPFKFVDQTTYNESVDKSKLKLIDTDIIDTLTTPDELSGFLNKALLGLKRLLKNKQFTYSKSLTEIKDMWVRKSDSFQAFCMDFVEEEIDGYVPKKTIRKMFANYCKLHKIKGASDIAIKARLENEFGVIDERVNFDKLGGGFEHCWTGIKIKENLWYKKTEDGYEKCQGCHGFSPYRENWESPIDPKRVATLTFLEEIKGLIFSKKEISLNYLLKNLDINEEVLLTNLDKLKRDGEIFEVRSGIYSKL